MMRARDRKRILVADDTLPMRIMLQDVLSEAGYEVTIAADGEEAWGTLRTAGDSIDLLILDLLMPRMTGFEILERFHELNQTNPKKVLVITGIFKSQKEVQRLRDLGANGYITKTALVDEILFRVNQVFHMGQENSRKFPRLLMSLPIDYRLRGSQYSNFTSNLSAGGAFIRTIDPAPPNETLELTFQLPEKNVAVKAAGRVVWTNEYETYRKKACLPGMGIEFVDLPATLKQHLSEYVTEKLQNEPVWLDT